MIPQSLAASPLTQHAWLWQRLISKCSTEALQVLGCLDESNAYDRGHRVCDRQISVKLGWTKPGARAHRAIIDLRDELLRAGLVMCTDNNDGTFIVLPGSDLALARADEQKMDKRAVAIHARAKHLRQAIDLYEQHARPAESTGQFNLGLPAAGTPRNQMEALTR
jgi:hypothetical protein